MQPMVNIALRAARIAGENLVRAAERLELVKSEQAESASVLRDTCKQIEKSMVYALHKSFPSHTIIGEYTGEHAPLEQGSPFEWHITPVDSLSNLANGIPSFALTMTGIANGKVEHALILNPVTGEEFTCSRGKGSQLNGRRIRVSSTKTLDGALLSNGYLNRSSDKHLLETHLEMYRKVSLAGARTLNNGSVALSLAHTAAGRFDGFYQTGLSDLEVEAGLMLLREAGGLISGFQGESSPGKEGEIAAANPKMLKALLKAIKA